MTSKSQLLKDAEAHPYMTKLMATNLAAPSKKQYRHKLLGLVELMNQPFNWIIDHPDECVNAIKELHQSDQTRKSYISAIKALFKYNDDIRGKHPGKHELWHVAYTEVDENILNRYINQHSTKKDNENWVVWSDVLNKEKELAKNEFASREHLLLAMYCLIEPLRQDFGNVVVFNNKVPPKADSGNYIVLNKTNPRLVLNDYKTAKSYGTFVRKLPKDLVNIIKASLIAHPRNILFCDSDGNPYSDNTYTKFANRTLFRLFDKHFTVSMMRHSFINTIDSNNTVAVFEKAKNMAHAVETQLLYKKIIKNINGGAVADETSDD